MTGIVEFLTARLDEDEAAVKAMGVERHGRWWASQRIDGSFDPEGSTVFVDVRRSDGLGYIHLGTPGMFAGPTAIHIARHDPPRVLVEVKAKRRIIGLHEVGRWTWEHQPGICDLPEGFKGPLTSYCITCSTTSREGLDNFYEPWPCETLKFLAASYDQHPDYDPAWRVE